LLLPVSQATSAVIAIDAPVSCQFGIQYLNRKRLSLSYTPCATEEMKRPRDTVSATAQRPSLAGFGRDRECDLDPMSFDSTSQHVDYQILTAYKRHRINADLRVSLWPGLAGSGRFPCFPAAAEYRRRAVAFALQPATLNQTGKVKDSTPSPICIPSVPLTQAHLSQSNQLGQLEFRQRTSSETR